MTFDPTKPVQTRDGQKARIIVTNANNPYYPIVALVTQDDVEEVETYTNMGRYFSDPQDGEAGLDLINIEPSKWANVYGGWYSSRQCADDARAGGRTALIEQRADGKIIVHEVER